MDFIVICIKLKISQVKRSLIDLTLIRYRSKTYTYQNTQKTRLETEAKPLANRFEI